ncbi:MAG: DUF3806 domain-containing protein [Planctomycetota bacterium]
MKDPKREPEASIVETDEGTVISHITEEEDFPQEAVRLSSAELVQFQTWEQGAQEFLTAYTQPQSQDELKQYDEAFQAWQRSPDRRHSDEDVINIVGAYLGQRMVRDFGMEWVLVTDKYGRDYAVRHKTSELMSFPFSSVMKRIEDKENGFVHGVYHVLKHELENGKWKQRTDLEE